MSTAETSSRTIASETLEIGVEAYVYLYPLVLMEITRRQGTNLPPGERMGVAPTGAFAHVREFPPAEFRSVVRPNFDTLYSSAWLDVSREPVIVSAPDTAGRYYLLPLLDMWTDVFAVPGSRTTGTGPGHFAIAGPGWDGRLPDGVQRIDAPTPHAWMIGRTQTNGPADYAAVHEVQDGLAITPLSQWGRAPVAPEAHTDPAVDMDTEPLAQVNALPAREFFALGAELMAVHAPHRTDWSVLARMRRIGVVPGQRFESDALAEVPAAALELMRGSLVRLAPLVNGWQTITEGIGVYGNGYLKRAVIAMAGLGANPPEDAVYPLGTTDAEGQRLDGEHDYVLHFGPGELPPAQAFWSVTMYDAEGFQVANPIDRFAIGDRDPLTYNADGSLDLFLQHDSPGPDHVANWLPAPRGPLGVTMRLYAPAPEALDGRWTPPAIRRIPAGANGSGA
jgi:hypothetical protein